MRILAALLFGLLVMGGPAQATLFWDDNFSNGLTNWNLAACQNGGNPPADPFFGCNPVIVNTRFFTASYSLKTTFHPTNPSIQQATYYDRLFPATKDVWTRQYLRLEGPGGVGPFVVDPTGTKHSIVYGNGPGFGAWLAQIFGSKTLHLILVNYPAIDQTSNVSMGFTPNDYQWYCLEVHINRGSPGVANGQIQFFVDTTQTYSVSNILLDTAETVCPPGSSCQGQAVTHDFTAYRHFGQYGSGDRYIDDIAVADTRIGCTPGQGGGGSPPPPSGTIPNAPTNLLVQ